MTSAKPVLKVFLCYASQDRPAVQDLYNALKTEDWIDPWLDRAKILPGQDWRIVIEKAVEEADIVIACLSTQSVNKEGFIQRELHYATTIAEEKPPETIFLIPLRLDRCVIPRWLRHLQWNDYFGAEKGNAHSNLLDALKLRYQQKYDVVIPRNQDRGAKLQQSDTNEQPRSRKGEPRSHPPVRNGATSNTRPKKRRIDPAVLAAIIGVAGTLLAALISIYGNKPLPTPTPLPTSTVTFTSTFTETSIPTDTATGTPVTPSPTSSPVTLTFTPTVMPVRLGEDWATDCISTLWHIYPSTISLVDNGNGCWKEPVYVFSAENGDLDVLAQRGSGSTEIYGLFAPLPVSGSVSFTVRLRELTNVDLWMGVFTEPDIDSDGLLMIIPNGDTRSRVIVHKDPHSYKNIANTQLLEQGPGFTISFAFNTLSATGRVDPNVFATNQYPVQTSQKWLFLGYKGLPGYYRIQGTFLEFELNP